MTNDPKHEPHWPRDTCRNAKRRCRWQIDNASGPGEACVRCHRLGQACTWRFVHAQLAGRRLVQFHASGSHGLGLGLASWEEAAPEGRRRSADFVTPWDLKRVGEGYAFVQAMPDAETTSGERARGLLVSPGQATDDSAQETIQPRKEGSIDVEDATHLLLHRAPVEDVARMSSLLRTHSWNSPLTVSLNDGFRRTVFREKQIEVHSLTQSGCENRYLADSSNPIICRDALTKQLPYLRSSVVEQGSNVDLSPGSQQFKYSTVSAALRVLDSFGELYANSLSFEDRNHALKAEVAVSEVMHMQWLPLRQVIQMNDSDPRDDDPVTGIADDLLDFHMARQIYETYWWRAQQLLSRSKASASFTRIMAVLTFNLAAIPDGMLSNLPPGDAPLDLLDRSLLQLQALLRMVRKFTDGLAEASTYKALFIYAAGCTQWFGYVRDTSTAMMLGRKTVLPDVCVLHSVVSHRQTIAASVSPDVHVLKPPDGPVEASQRLSLDTVALWRLTTRISGVGASSAADLSGREAVIQSCSNLIEEIHTSVVPILENCLRDGGTVISADSASFGKSLPDRPSARLRRLIRPTAHMLLSWNFGVLKFIRSSRQHHDWVATDSSASLELNAFEEAIVRSMDIVTAVLTSEEHCSVTDIPIIAQNSNLPLVSQILAAFVDHAVSICTGSTRATSVPSTAISGLLVSRTYISRLLRGLSMLQRATPGPSIAREALRNLFSRHTDFLVDIWLSSEDSRDRWES